MNNIPEFQIQLPGLELGLLKADKISIKFPEYIGKALTGYGPEAIYVPTDEFHVINI